MMQVPTSLIGSQVYQVKFDYQTAIELFHQDDSTMAIRVHAWLTIYTTFVLRSGDGSIHELNPETSRAALAPVIDLFLGTVTGVTVEGCGTLTLDFTDGARLTVPPDESYESWELSGVGVPGILVGPGGQTDWT
jgi:uncharacterized protein DUF6188